MAEPFAGRRASRDGPKRIFIALTLLLAASPLAAAEQAKSTPNELASHGLSMVGAPALPQNFDHLPYADPNAPKGGRLRLGLLGTFENLNRFNAKFLRAPLFLVGAVYESLMIRSEDEPKTYYGLIAQSVDIDDAREHVTFHLDPRAHFSDGVPITSADVQFTFDLLKEKGVPQRRSDFGLVKSLEAIDAHTVRFDLSGADDRELPLVLAAMPVLPKHATDAAHFTEASLAAPTASGPYVVVEVRTGERLVLRRDPNYWGKDIPIRRGLYNFDEIDVDYYKDAGALFEAFKAGLVDFREENSANQWANGYDFPALADGRVVKETLKPGRPVGIEGFVFNLRREMFRDVRVREAIGMMLDFEWINANLYSNLYTRTKSYFDESEYSSSGRPASAAERAVLARFPGVVREDILEGRWLPPAHDGSGRDRDIARRAQALLTEAGYKSIDGALAKDGVPLRFEITVRNRDEERLALNFSASLAKIGVDAQVRSQEETLYNRRRQKFDFDIIVGQWLTVAAPGGEQRGRWGAGTAARESSVNLSGASSEAADAMIDALVAARSESDLVAAARALDRVLLSGFFLCPCTTRRRSGRPIPATSRIPRITRATPWLLSG
jgi:peptide/nickel transport system substrate-binding protein